MTTTTVAPPTNRHLIEVTGTGEDQTFRVVCPDGGKSCESCVECDKEHRCDCGPHPHGADCDEDCDDDHALECDEWLYRDGMMHGEHHLYAGGLICVRETETCWMREWDIELADRDIDYAPGLYEFDYDQDSAYYDGGDTLDVTAMRPVTV